MKIYAASKEQMEAFIAAQSVDALKAAYTEMLNGSLSHPDQWEWYAIWMIELADGTHIGELCFKGITVEGNYKFYNKVVFRTSSECGVYPVCGYPMTEPRCQMIQETYNGSLDGIHGYVVYDMYFNA